MQRLWIVLAVAGCTRSLGLQPGGHDLAQPGARDGGIVDAALVDAAQAQDLSPPPAWRPQTSNTTQGLRGVWGSSASDVYVVGAQGTILHSRGDGVWTPQTSGTAKDLHAIWGAGPHDLYAAGDVLLRSSGDGNWRTESAPSTLMGVWGSAANDVYIAGVFGISHSTGNGTWSAVNQAEPWGGYFHVRGTSATDVYAVGGFINLNDPSRGGGVAHFSSGQWSWTLLSPPDEMKDIVFTARGAFIVGLSGQIWANAGAGGTWTRQASPVPWDLQALWADDAGKLYAVGGSGTVLTSDGDGNWAAQASLFALDLWGVWGSGAHDIYAVGDEGKIFHFN
jgi:photosystem II stability/assembly factor-like uncharacterized protein